MKFKEWLLGAPQKAFDLPAQEKGSTEGWLPVADIRNGVILLKDGRIVKILEVLPVLFDLKSDMEKENLIYYFASYLKIAPTHLQLSLIHIFPAPYLQYGLTAGSVLALLIILAVLWNRRKNAKIYALLDGEFKIDVYKRQGLISQ